MLQKYQQWLHLRLVTTRAAMTINLRSGDTRLREGTAKTVLRPTLTVTSSVVFWTSTRELRKFRGSHSCKLNCEVGILGCERGQQKRAFDRLLQLLVQLCFGLRRGNLENFAEDIPAMGILGCERGQQRRAFDRLLQLLVQLCFGLRRGNLENFAEAISAKLTKNFHFTFSGDFDNLSPRVDLEIFALSEDFENLSPRLDLEIFADVIRTSINEDLKAVSLFTGLGPYLCLAMHELEESSQPAEKAVSLFTGLGPYLCLAMHELEENS
ncbi:hypothetical protein HZH68_015549 [Vespula germanica]|uniref:Uncharacterized protein n=1 Tax=Vespula germanica TaxID=30212 RepID=A0A834J744_VESGE|nr:hypothetical protein HZH68_015549 [Vespula germanica]